MLDQYDMEKKFVSELRKIEGDFHYMMMHSNIRFGTIKMTNNAIASLLMIEEAFMDDVNYFIRLHFI